MSKTKPLRIFRIRKCSSYGGGGRCYYHHADIVATSRTEALKAAVQGRVVHWRLVDSYDWSDEPYESHFFIFEVKEGQWKVDPVHPTDKLGHFRINIPLEARESWSSYLNNDGPTPKQVQLWLRPLRTTAKRKRAV